MFIRKYVQTSTDTLSEFHTGLGAGIVACAYSNEDKPTTATLDGVRPRIP